MQGSMRKPPKGFGREAMELDFFHEFENGFLHRPASTEPAAVEAEFLIACTDVEVSVLGYRVDETPASAGDAINL